MNLTTEPVHTPGEFLMLPGTSVLIHPERKHMLQISRPDGKRFIAILKCQNK